MARNNDRQFSESETLSARDLGASAPEAEERMPLWAQSREEEKQREMAKREAEEEREHSRNETADAPVKGTEEDEASEPAQAAGEEDALDIREQAEEAWTREAQRVESSQNRRNRAPAQEAEEAPNAKGKAGKGKKAGKKGKARKKKNATKQEERRSFLRTMIIVLVCGLLFLMTAMMVVSNFLPSIPILAVPRQLVNRIITPLQSAFSTVTDDVVNYLRTLKIRGNLEYEYEQLLIKLDDMANDSAIAEELRRENQALRDQLPEQQSNRDMNGLLAQVIGKVGNNYFSTLTLNVGTSDGVTDYMAVVNGGGLVGVTYNTQEHSCEVRCIIDSDCTVAGLVQSSRDQGSVKGTLGTNGEPMCRMYYLPDNSLPRPGDVVVTSGVGLEFPKGIPIGYIRESIRGMEDNKSYVVLEPVVDFQHLEYVTVYRYRPYYAEDAQSRVNASSNIALEPLATARPIPGFEMEGLSDFMRGATATPGAEAMETPAPQEGGQATAAPTRTPDPNATPLPENLEYHMANPIGVTATPSPRPTFTPTPSPVPTPDPGAMTVEDDE